MYTNLYWLAPVILFMSRFRTTVYHIGTVYCWIGTTTIHQCRRTRVQAVHAQKISFLMSPHQVGTSVSCDVSNMIYATFSSENNDLHQTDFVTSSPISSLKVLLRNATINDLQLLQYWDEKEHLVGSYGPDEELNDWNWEYELPRTNISWRYQLIAEVQEDNSNNDSVPIGFVQIIDPLEEESHYWGIDCEPNLRAIDIWIGDERYLNRGYGTQIMKQVLQSSFVFGNTNVTGVIIDPMAENVAAHRFYQRLGFVPIGIRFFGEDKCLIHRMNRTEYVNAHPDSQLNIPSPSSF